MALTLLVVVAASAQQVDVPPAPATPLEQSASPPPPPPPPQATPSFRPGFLHALGSWFGKSFGAVKSGIKNTRETIADFGDKAGKAAKGTATTIVRLPGTRLVNGREKCTPAPNGAPDCYAAAAALCHGKGYNGGKSIETQQAQKCPAQVWLSGRSPQEGECATETFVTRAVCN